MSGKRFNHYEKHFDFGRKSERIRFQNADYVHPLKQDLVQDLQREFALDANIRAVVVFGSAVEFRCNSRSDLDLCIERYDTQKSFQNPTMEEIDLLYWDRIGERLKAEIDQKGIVVYDKEGIYV